MLLYQILFIKKTFVGKNVVEYTFIIMIMFIIVCHLCSGITRIALRKKAIKTLSHHFKLPPLRRNIEKVSVQGNVFGCYTQRSGSSDSEIGGMIATSRLLCYC